MHSTSMGRKPWNNTININYISHFKSETKTEVLHENAFQDL